MTKGASVFLQPPKTEARSSSHKPKFHPHVHFSRSLTNGSSGEQNNGEPIPDVLDEMQSKIHKGRAGFHAQSQQLSKDHSKADILLDKNFNGETFKETERPEFVPNISTDTKELQQDAGLSRKKGVRKNSVKSTGTTRPKSSKPAGNVKRSKPTGMSTSKNMGLEEDDTKNELQMGNEYDYGMEGVINTGKGPSAEESPSVGYASHPNAELKRSPSNDTETEAGNDDTSKDFTSLSLTTASAAGAKQKEIDSNISVTNEAQ